MEAENKSPKKSPVKMVFGLFMIFFYLCISVLLVFTPIFSNVPLVGRIIMGVLFFAYGLFRAYRAWREQ